jgi:hypothetical protein
MDEWAEGDRTKNTTIHKNMKQKKGGRSHRSPRNLVVTLAPLEDVPSPLVYFIDDAETSPLLSSLDHLLDEVGILGDSQDGRKELIVEVTALEHLLHLQPPRTNPHGGRTAEPLKPLKAETTARGGEASVAAECGPARDLALAMAPREALRGTAATPAPPTSAKSSSAVTPWRPTKSSRWYSTSSTYF